MERREINIQTGEVVVIPLTANEIAEARVRDAEEKAQRAAMPAPVDLRKLEAWAKTMGYAP